MALASAGTIVLCLLILGMSYSIGKNIEYVLKQIEMKFGITSYVEEGVSDRRILEIRTQIENIPQVIKVDYISKEEALKTFSEQSQKDILFEDFKKDNPLPASFEIIVANVSAQEQVVAELDKIVELDTIYLKTETDLFEKLNNTINYVSYIISLGLVIVGLLLMANTIKLTVYIRRKEINIMKYIGATDWFIRLPFLIEGLVIGIIGAIIAIILIVIGYNSLNDFMITNLASVIKGLSFKSTGEIMRHLIPMYLSIGMSIGLIGSGMAIHKHLKV